MHFSLLKTSSFLAVPSNLIACLVLAGLLLLFFRRRAGAVVLYSGAVALCVAGLSPLGNVLLTPLEQRFPEMKFPDQSIDGIIVLGGSYDAQSHGYLSTIVLEEDTEPMAIMVDLARRYQKLASFFPAAQTRQALGRARRQL